MNYGDMTKDELLVLASERGIDVPSSANKSAVIALLESWDDANPVPEEEVDVDALLTELEELRNYKAARESAVVYVETETTEFSDIETAAREILRHIQASDSRWADMSGRDRAVVEYAVQKRWLEADSDNNLEKQRYRFMLTERGIRALDQD